MKYVYTQDNINRSIPENVPVRLIIGGILGLIAAIMLVCTMASATDIVGVVLLLAGSTLCATISYLMIFFAIRTFRAIRLTRSRMPEDLIFSDPDNPFYSSQCSNCGVLIDYQQADLAYRPWFIRGYVECPCCLKPIRHNKEKNVYVPHRYPTQSYTPPMGSSRYSS